MSYADTLAEMAAQYRAELSAIERERMASRFKSHGIACEENRRIHVVYLRRTHQNHGAETMTDYRNPDNVGNHLEAYGYEGWSDIQDVDLAEWNPWDDPDRGRDD